MVLSRESQEYHLTPSGWRTGSFHADSLGGSISAETPSDRVLSVECYEEWPHIKAKPRFYDQVTWESEDKDLIKELKEKFGSKPDWFGYKRKKR